MKTMIITICVVALGLGIQCSASDNAFKQPKLGANKVQIIKQGKYEFKDLNKNNKLDPYEDWRLPVDKRIDNLVSQMTLEEKVGLMFHPNIAVTEDGSIKYELTEEDKKKIAMNEDPSYTGPIGPGGQGGGAMLPGQVSLHACANDYILKNNFRSILNNGIAAPAVFAKWSNSMQEIAEGSRLGIPIMFSSDPRHGASLGAHVSGNQYFSQWPSKEGQVGITASRDTSLVKEYGRITAEEYRAVGLHMILGPQIDVITNPGYDRNMGAFSEDANLTSSLVSAFIEGAQGESVGPEKILVQLKHYPGSGPVSISNSEQLVYPGNNFEYHLLPWKAGISKGVIAVMGAYAGTSLNSDKGLAVNFSKYILTTVLRDQLHFEGAVCADWFAINGHGPLREDIISFSTKERYLMAINSGLDQIGGEIYVKPVLELVKEGKLSEERVNQAAKRILKWHFALGLFENPYVDEQAAAKIVRSEKNQKAGYQAQLESITLLANDGTLPVKKTGKINLYISGIDSSAAAEYATIVSDPQKADLILIRTTTEADRGAFGGPMGMPAGAPPGGAGANGKGPAAKQMPTQGNDLNFPVDKWTAIKKLAASGTPVVVAFNTTGAVPILPGDLKEVTQASLMIFDVLDRPLLDVVFGKFNPIGKLPFDIPSSMEAVRNQKEDVPFDTKDPSFKYGFGLSYK